MELSEGVSPRVCGLRLGAAQDSGWVVRTPHMAPHVGWTSSQHGGQAPRASVSRESREETWFPLGSVGPLPRHGLGLGAHEEPPGSGGGNTPALMGGSRSHGPKSVRPVDMAPRKRQAARRLAASRL